MRPPCPGPTRSHPHPIAPAPDRTRSTGIHISHTREKKFPLPLDKLQKVSYIIFINEGSWGLGKSSPSVTRDARPGLRKKRPTGSSNGNERRFLRNSGPGKSLNRSHRLHLESPVLGSPAHFKIIPIPFGRVWSKPVDLLWALPQYFSVREKGEGRREKGEPVGVFTWCPLPTPHSPQLTPHSPLPTPHSPPSEFRGIPRSIGGASASWQGRPGGRSPVVDEKVNSTAG